MTSEALVSAHPLHYRMLGEGRPNIPKPDGAEVITGIGPQK
jgi:hypothetical protein